MLAFVGKTATKFAKPSPRSGVALPLGAHPGNTGGKPGRSGRKSDAFLSKCIAAIEDAELWAEARKRNPVSVLQLAAEYTKSKAPTKVDQKTEIVLKAVRE